MNHLPEIVLDDRRFQELVSEARTRIALSCPEWTEHNVSDPGITLIELFAWMTDMLIYRLNRVPDKLHVALLELLGVQLHGPTAARTQIRFRLAAPAEQPVEIPAATTEVGTLRTAADDSIVFQVSDDVCDLAARAGGVRGRAQRQLQVDRCRRRHGEAAGPRPAPVRVAAGGRRRSVPRVRRGHLGPVDARRDRRIRCPRRRRGSQRSAASLGGQRRQRRLDRGRGSRGPHGWLQLRRRRRRAAVPAAVRRRAAGGPSPALAALHDLRSDPRRRRGGIQPPTRDLCDRRQADRRARRRRARGP